MSKIGNKTIEIPEKVTVTVENGGIYNNQLVKVSGPLGELVQDIRPNINVEVKDKTVIVSRINEDKQTKAYHGLYRSLIANMVKGVETVYEKKLEIHGVGYRGIQKGDSIELALGFSHKVNYKPHNGITIKMIDDNTILVSGKDKQLVGQTASEIRSLRKPEPYKGKGIRYFGEQIRRKAGKTAASK